MVNNSCIEGIDSSTGKPKFCETCVLAKSKKLFFKHKEQKATHSFQIIHSDVGGPVTLADSHGNKYWILFIDGYGHFPWVYFIKRKSEALTCFCEFKSDVQIYLGAKIGELHLSENFIKFFQSDNERKYVSGKFQEELRKTGTVHLTTAPNTPKQNGLAEHMNQTLMNTATAMLIESGLPKTFWSDAMATAATVIGRTPASGLKGKVPYKVIFKRKVDISWLCPFGSTAYALIPKDKCDRKFANKAHKAVLIGYTTRKKAYKLLDIKTRKEFSSRHVQFNEDSHLNSKISN